MNRIPKTKGVIEVVETFDDNPEFGTKEIRDIFMPRSGACISEGTVKILKTLAKEKMDELGKRCLIRHE